MKIGMRIGIGSYVQFGKRFFAEARHRSPPPYATKALFDTFLRFGRKHKSFTKKCVDSRQFLSILLQFLSILCFFAIYSHPENHILKAAKVAAEIWLCRQGFKRFWSQMAPRPIYRDKRRNMAPQEHGAHAGKVAKVKISLRETQEFYGKFSFFRWRARSFSCSLFRFSFFRWRARR